MVRKVHITNKSGKKNYSLDIFICYVYFAEVIGRLETQEGKNLGEVVIMNRGKARSKSKLRRRKNKFTCQLCGRNFLQRSRYIVHK